MRESGRAAKTGNGHRHDQLLKFSSCMDVAEMGDLTWTDFWFRELDLQNSGYWNYLL